MSRAKPAPRFIVPQVYMWDPLNRKVKGAAVFKGDPVEVSAVAEDRDNAAVVIETGGVNLKPDTPYIAVFTTLNAGNSGLWNPLTSVSVQLIDTGYGEGQFLVSNADTLDGPVWNDGNGRSLTFWMAFEQPIAALVNGATVTTKTPQVAVKAGQTRALKFTVRATEATESTSAARQSECFCIPSHTTGDQRRLLRDLQRSIHRDPARGRHTPAGLCGPQG